MTDLPEPTVPAYILQDDPKWDAATRAAKIEEMSEWGRRRAREARADGAEQAWVVFEYLDGRKIVIYQPPPPDGTHRTKGG